MKDLECRYHRFRGDASPTAQSGLKPVNSADGRQPQRGTAAVFDRFRLADSNQPDDIIQAALTESLCRISSFLRCPG